MGTDLKTVASNLLPLKGRLAGTHFSEAINDLATAYFGDGWVQRDERFRALPALARRSVAIDFDFDFDFASEAEIAASPYYQELLARCGLRWSAGVKVAAGPDLAVLCIQCSIDQGPFEHIGCAPWRPRRRTRPAQRRLVARSVSPVRRPPLLLSKRATCP